MKFTVYLQSFTLSVLIFPRVQPTTRKPPDALSLTVDGYKPVAVFSGTAKEAIAKFPKNINVAVTLSLAGLGVDQTRVEILADPRPIP
jgi:aspartate dehydrogenase